MAISEIITYFFLGIIVLVAFMAVVYGVAWGAYWMSEILGALIFKKEPNDKVKKYLLNISLGVIVLTIVGVIFGGRIYDGFSSVQYLTNKCRVNSEYYYRTGAICMDGWKSSSTGRGTCSYHGGVKEWLYDKDFRKTTLECEKWAKKRSWIE